MVIFPLNRWDTEAGEVLALGFLQENIWNETLERSFWESKKVFFFLAEGVSQELSVEKKETWDRKASCLRSKLS